MSRLAGIVRHEVEDLHAFFTAWIGGTADRSELEARLVPRLHPEFVIVSPEGSVTGKRELVADFERVYGSSPGFRIRIRDVLVRFAEPGQVLATYTEWQVGAQNSSQSRNARFSTVLLKPGDPFQWLHVHETWLPETTRAADQFDF